MVYSIKNKMGKILIDNDVIAQNINYIVFRCKGIVDLVPFNGVKGKFNEVFGEKSNKGIRINVSEENKLSLTFNIMIEYGTKIPRLTDNISKEIANVLEDKLGINDYNINIIVKNIKF